MNRNLISNKESLKKSPNRKSPNRKSPKESPNRKSPNKKYPNRKSHNKKSHNKKSQMLDIKDNNLNILKFFNFDDKNSKWFEKINKLITNSFLNCLLFLNFYGINNIIQQENIKNKNFYLSEYNITDSLNILNLKGTFLQALNITINDINDYLEFKKILNINSFTLVQFLNIPEDTKYFIIGLSKNSELFIYDPYNDFYTNISLNFDDFTSLFDKYENINIFVKTTVYQEKFKEICDHFIFSQNLDGVIQKVHLKHGNNNIFLFGEVHKKKGHNDKIGISKMLEDLVNFNLEHCGDLLKIDFFLEMSHSTLEQIIDPNAAQINDVRSKFIDIIKNKNINNFFVHWTDPFSISKKNQQYNNSKLWLKKASKSIEEGLIRNDFDLLYKWVDDPDIIKDFNLRNDPTHIFKILNDNLIFIKELKKAESSNPLFTLRNMEMIFLKIYTITIEQAKEISDIDDDMKRLYVIFNMWRVVMDFYIITRIASKNLENVIFYGGCAHTERIKFILIKYFEFELVKEVIQEDTDFPFSTLQQIWLPIEKCRNKY